MKTFHANLLAISVKDVLEERGVVFESESFEDNPRNLLILSLINKLLDERFIFCDINP